jgi:hypothetical protein
VFHCALRIAWTQTREKRACLRLMEVALASTVVHVGPSTRNQMVYLSANGEVIGQFEESELPSALANGRVPSDSFFWREGMHEWRSLRELVLPPRPQSTAPASKPSAAFPSPTINPAEPAAPAKLQATPKSTAIKPAIAQKAPFVPRTPALAPDTSAAAVQGCPEHAPAPGEAPSAPAKPVRKVFLPQAKWAPAPEVAAPASGREMVATVASSDRPAPAGKRTPLPSARQETPAARFAAQSEPFAQPALASSAPAPAPGVMLAAAKARGRSVFKGLLFAAFLILLGALGAAAWWFFPKQPPALEGQVRLAAADGTATPVAGARVFLVSREELAARWRDGLAETQSRSAEVGELLKQATVVHREKFLALELAARTSELADEYNMPDAADLRTARDAAQAEEAPALAEVEQLKREMESLTSSASLLQAPADALDQTRTDDSGAFRLTLPESTDGLVVLVLAGTDGADVPDRRGWLVPLVGQEERKAPVLLSSDNALESTQIAEIAGTPFPAGMEN